MGPMSIGAEVEVKSLPNSDSWRQGRRMVNLGVIVDGLKEGCRRCHELLQLSDCVGECNITKVMTCLLTIPRFAFILTMYDYILNNLNMYNLILSMY